MTNNTYEITSELIGDSEHATLEQILQIVNEWRYEGWTLRVEEHWSGTVRVYADRSDSEERTPNIYTDWLMIDADTCYITVAELVVAETTTFDLAANEMPSVQQPAPRKINVGDTVRVLPHTAYQHLSHGAVITPMAEHRRDGYKTSVVAVFQDQLEDEAGNLVIEYTYEVATGELFSRDQIELV